MLNSKQFLLPPQKPLKGAKKLTSNRSTIKTKKPPHLFHPAGTGPGEAVSRRKSVQGVWRSLVL